MLEYKGRLFGCNLSFSDALVFIFLGRRKLLQCLLAIHQTLSSSEPYYVLNSLFLTDYCVWIQRARYQV